MLELRRLELTVGDIKKGFYDNDDGAGGWDGKLDIRPFYQRENIYNMDRKIAVIDSIRNKYPINIMYFAKKDDGTYEVLDGQQRILSFCEYVHNKFPVDEFYFHNKSEPEQDEILKYPLIIYTCDGSFADKFKWFERINVAGVELTKQELRNAAYAGTWVTAAKKYFGKPNCPAGRIASRYIDKRLLRQEFLETAICWHIGSRVDKRIREYMNENCRKPNADELWLYFSEVINWIETKFPIYRHYMKDVDWGALYNTYKNTERGADALEERVSVLMSDRRVHDKPGIYEYVLGGETEKKLLNIRVFDDTTKEVVYAEQTEEARADGISNCPMCAAGHESNRNKLWDYDDMEADHVSAWSRDGATDISNCQMLCRTHNRLKGNR